MGCTSIPGSTLCIKGSLLDISPMLQVKILMRQHWMIAASSVLGIPLRSHKGRVPRYNKENS